METEEVAAEVPTEEHTEVPTEEHTVVPTGPLVEEENENKELTTSTEPQDDVTDNNKEKVATKMEGESLEVMDNPACDWLEPLDEDCEDVDGQSFDQDGTGDAELESLAGSEWSGSVTSRRNVGERGGRGGGPRPRRGRHCESNENWEDWPILGQGWKRRQVFRRSGTSEGRSDTYYMSSQGHKVRSKVELLKYVDESLDLRNFDFKSGLIVDGVPQRGRRRKFIPYFNQKDANVSPPKSSPHTYPVTDFPPTEPTANPAVSPSGDGLVNGNGESSQPLFRVCERCNNTLSVGEGQSVCQNCRKELNTPIDRRRKPYRKWIPCGQCRACQITVDCGKCVSCRNSRLHHRLNVRSRKIKCRKRKCLQPMRREKMAKVIPQSSNELFANTVSLETPSSYFKPPVSDFEESQSSFLQYSDSEDLSMFLGNDGDSYMDEFGSTKVRRRSCGCCRGCIRRTDCGTCDFCMDKPKFGGRNKKRQKCRLRQCQREAMKHLLPMDKGQMQMYVPQDWVNRGRPRGRGRPRKTLDLELSDNEAEQYERLKPSGAVHMANRKAFLFPSYNGKKPGFQYKDLPAAKCENSTFQSSYVEESFKQEKRSQISASWESYQERESSPSITQIFSMDDSATKGIDPDHELMPLLKSLRSVVLPVLWFCIVAEGPRLQLMQCSKCSAMADTIVNIEPSFQYHISVQGQPLLPTHKLYDVHPTRLTTTTEIVSLLEDLERHSVCQGFENKGFTLRHLAQPVLPERAATCDFLILSELERCAKCSTKLKHQA